MKRIIFLSTVVLIVVGCTTPEEVSKPSGTAHIEKSNLQLNCLIEPTKAKYKAGEPIEVSVLITNSSGSDVSTAFWGLKKDHPIVNFRVVDSKNKTSLISTKQALWCGTGVGNEAISPGAEYRFSVDLSELWEWGGVKATFPPETYNVSAELFCQTPKGGRPIVGKSKSITFELILGE